MSCCGPKSVVDAAVSTGGCSGGMSGPNGINDTLVDTHSMVQDYYGKVVSTSNDLKTNACTAGAGPHRYVRKVLAKVPQEVLTKFLGCGAHLPLGIEGLKVLDLGSGSGRDCYACAALVGEKGSVIGVDMTPEQIELSNKYVEDYTKTLGYLTPNMSFVEGHIEYLDKAGIKDESVDVVISNCVVNLCPDKPRVLKEVYRALTPGGEFYFSDMYCDRRLSEDARKNKVCAVCF